MLDLPESNGALTAGAFGLTAGGAWGVADFYGAKAAKAFHPIQAAGAAKLVGSAAFALVFALFMPASATFEGVGAAYATAGGVFLALGLMTFFSGLAVGPVSIVSPLGSAYPLVTTLLAIALFAARPTGMQIVGIALIVIGVVACSGIAEAKRSEARVTRGVVMGAATFTLWGIGFVFIDQGVSRLGWETATLVQTVAIAVTFAVALGVLHLRGAPSGFARLFANPLVIGAGLILLAGDVCFNVGLTSSNEAGGTIVTAISACYPALTILLALRHFDEEVRVASLGGAILAITGVIAVVAA